MIISMAWIMMMNKKTEKKKEHRGNFCLAFGQIVYVPEQYYQWNGARNEYICLLAQHHSLQFSSSISIFRLDMTVIFGNLYSLFTRKKWIANS